MPLSTLLQRKRRVVVVLELDNTRSIDLSTKYYSVKPFRFVAVLYITELRDLGTLTEKTEGHHRRRVVSLDPRATRSLRRRSLKTRPHNHLVEVGTTAVPCPASLE